MKKVILVAMLAALPLAGFAKKPGEPLPTDEAGLHAAAEKGNPEAMYRLGRLLDDVELTMDLESVKVTTSPGAGRTRRACEWYAKAARKGHREAQWRCFCLLVYPREGIDGMETKKRENRAVGYGKRTIPAKADYHYFVALLYYYGGPHFGFYGRSYLGIVRSNAYLAHYFAKKFVNTVDASHPLYRNAQVVMGATQQVYSAERQAMWGTMLGSLTSAAAAYKTGGGNLQAFSNEMSRQSLSASLDALTATPVSSDTPASSAVQTQSGVPTALEMSAPLAAAAPVTPAEEWRIKFSPEYIERVTAQCEQMGIVPPKYTETGYSEETFASAPDARAWLHGKFSGGPLSDLYRAGKIGMPEQIEKINLELCSACAHFPSGDTGCASTILK